MTAADTNTAAPLAHGDYNRPNWFVRAENWLDERGKPAWIGAIVLGFIFFWPAGLALLVYMLFFRKHGGLTSGRAKRMRHGISRMAGSTGNKAFDSYKAETLRRLQEEQDNFEAFLERLREAKDKAEFDQFMDERANKTRHRDTKPDDHDTGDNGSDDRNAA